MKTDKSTRSCDKCAKWKIRVRGSSGDANLGYCTKTDKLTWYWDGLDCPYFTSDIDRLAAWVKRACSNVRRPKNLQEIVDDLEGNEYNAEQTVQHMAIWICRELNNMVKNHRVVRENPCSGSMNKIDRL